MTADINPQERQAKGMHLQRKKFPVMSVILIIISLATSVFFINISSQRAVSNLEGSLFQIISLFAGFAGSYIFGLASAREAAKDLIQPHARSSFRRVWSLYMSLSRLAGAIDKAKDYEESELGRFSPLDMLQAMVFEQIATAGDALEDWRDIVPEDVQEIEARIRKDIPTTR